MKKSGNTEHKWTFFKAGGVYQANIESGDDIANIGLLDQTLWAALSCPTKGVHFDRKTLELLDQNGDGRIRSPEIVSLCEWVCGLLKNPDKLVSSPKTLLLDDIDVSNPEGAALYSSAEEIMKNLGRPEAEGLAPEIFDDQTKIFSHSVFNADGIVTEDASEDNSLKSAIRAIISVMGSSMDRSGKDGVSEASIKEFYERFDAYNAWKAKAADDIMVFGDQTENLYSVFSAIEKKLDEYFEYSRIISFDVSSESSINATAEKFKKIMGAENEKEELSKLPLACVLIGGELDLLSVINPIWRERFLAFKTQILANVFFETETLSESVWNQIKLKFAPYTAWLLQKDDRGISALSAQELETLSKPETKTGLEALIAKDWELKADVENISKLEKLTRLNTHLYALLNNIVSFKSFYKRDGSAMFQIGRLFFDQRECDLCIKVDDASKHAALSPMSYIYLIYCTCTRNGEESFDIAAAITAGDCDTIQVGRNGLFYDREGRDWDATVTKIVSNPISIKQAFWSPYKRFVAWISEQIAKRAASADASAVNKMSAGLESAEATVKDPKQPKKIDIGTVAALGVAVGGITAAFGVILSAMKGIHAWQYPIILIGVMLAISLPSMVIAAMKLRQRNLGPLLDANNWAVNTRAKLNFKLGATLTRPAKIPFSARTEKDPFEEKKPYGKILLAAIILGALAVGAIEYKYSWIRSGVEKISTSRNQEKASALTADAENPEPAAAE